jgi:hypothetical protein
MGMYLYGISQKVVGKFKGEPVYKGTYIGKPYISWEGKTQNNRMYGRAKACTTRFEKKGIVPKYFALDNGCDEIWESKQGRAWLEDYDLGDPAKFPVVSSGFPFREDRF